MADYVAVLKKTIEGLGETTPEVRKKVYAKARATITKRLQAIDPPPAKQVFDRQMQALEDAVEQVEAEYAAQDGSDDDVGGASAPVIERDDNERWSDPAEQVRRTGPAPRRRSMAGLVWALVIVVLLGGGGYLVWMNRSAIADFADLAMSLVGGGSNDTPGTAGGGQQTGDGSGSGAGSGAAGGGQADQSTTKFTQRLLPDGREVDDGPASGEPTVGEGTSVSTQSPRGEQMAQADSGGAEQAAAGGGDQQVPVGQKAIFYEERTSSLEGSAEPGAVVWSVVQESPGGDFPPEAAIRGEVKIPGKDLNLRITFRRNADKTLPASHIIELVFTTPDNFDGGGIDSVLRIALKSSEQATGNPLIGIPAKIADGFFLVALTDAKAEVETNMTLLRRQNWIDVPLTYASGRRALITMEKGLPGDKVFDEVIAAWQQSAGEPAAGNGN